MKVLKIILTLCVLQSCNGQENKAVTTYSKEKTMSTEQFDVDNFKKYQEAQQNLPDGNPSERILEKNGTTITEYAVLTKDDIVDYGKEILPPKPALFYSVMIFRDNGKIKESIDQVFLGTFDFDYGIHKFYDENAVHTKTVDNSKQYENLPIKIEDLLKILSNEMLRAETISKSVEDELISKWFSTEEKVTSEMVINKLKEIFKNTSAERGVFESKFLNPNNREDVQRIRIGFDQGNSHWLVTKDFSVLGKIKLVIDAKSGKVQNTSYEL